MSGSFGFCNVSNGTVTKGDTMKTHMSILTAALAVAIAMAPMLGMTAEPRDAGSAEKAREEMLATKIRTERAKVTAEKQRVYEAAVERCKAAEKKYEVARKVARAKNAPKGASEAVKLAKGALNAAEDAVASSEKELKAARKAEGAALDDARTQLKAERRAAEEKKAAEARAAAEKAKVEKAAEAKAAAEKAKAEKAAQKAKERADAEKKAAEAKAAAEKAKAEETSTARGSDIEATLAASGITITGDTDWFGRAKTTDGRTLKQVFAEALAVTNVAGAVEIAQKAARDNGYYLCAVGAEKNGEVKVEAGRFSQVDIRFGKENAPEGRWFTSSQIRERLERSMVQTGEPFNYNALYSQFRDLNSNPDLAANIELRLAQDESEGRALGVDVNVEEEWPFHAIFGIDNYGTDSVRNSPDEWMGRITLQRLNLWKADHALTLNGYSAIDGTLYGGAGSYYIPFTLLDDRDAAITVHGGYSKVDADEVVKHIDVVGTGWFAGAQVSTELLTSLDYSLRLALGVTYRTTEDYLRLYDEEQQREESLDATEVDIIPMSVALMFSNRNLDSLYGRTYLTLEGVYNLGGSDEAEFELQRRDADPDYWLARAQLARIQTFGGTLTDGGYAGRSLVFAKVEAQYAGGALIPAEQMGVGGANSVRGYKEREYLGDHAAVFTLEYRTPLLLGMITRPLEDATTAAKDRLQFVVFSDVGITSREDPLPGEKDNMTLWGAGVGLRFAWSENFQFRCDYALPIEETVESEMSDGGRFHISAQCQF